MSDACMDSGKFIISMMGVVLIIAGTVVCETERHSHSGLVLFCLGWLFLLYSFSLKRSINGEKGGKLEFKPSSNKPVIFSSVCVIIFTLLLHYNHTPIPLRVIGVGFFLSWLCLLYALINSDNTKKVTYVDWDSDKIRRMIAGCAVLLITFGTYSLGLKHNNTLHGMSLPYISIGWVFVALVSAMRV